MRYVRELATYIDVDIMGKCGDIHYCEKGANFSCRGDVVKDYLFYISFENSNCREYITEKVYTDALR